MKKFTKKSLMLLISVALLLTFAVSGTVAYLVAGTEKVTNTFTPADVEITVTDTVEDYVKYRPTITNDGDIPVYVRVAVVAYWEKENQIVASWNEDLTSVLNSGWVKKDDGYYYYTQPVAAGGSAVLFERYEQPTPPVEGVHLEMTIIAQAVQTEPAQALTDANWAWTP